MLLRGSDRGSAVGPRLERCRDIARQRPTAPVHGAHQRRIRGWDHWTAVTTIITAAMKTNPAATVTKGWPNPCKARCIRTLVTTADMSLASCMCPPRQVPRRRRSPRAGDPLGGGQSVGSVLPRSAGPATVQTPSYTCSV
jgi:hypothetical protein